MSRLAVILPMYNEADNVEPLVERLAAVRAASGLDLFVLAVDDGSDDATPMRLRAARRRYPFVRVVRHTSNRGMAAALRTGIATALSERGQGFDLLAFMDADLTHPPEDLPALLEPIQLNDADLVLGSRYVPGGGMHGVPWPRQLISRIGNWAGRNVLGVPVADLTSGFRVGRVEVFRSITLEESGFGIQLEGTIKAYRAGFRTAEVPITLGVRKRGYSKMAYTRDFWLGYARLLARLAMTPAQPRAALISSTIRLEAEPTLTPSPYPPRPSSS